MRLINTSDNQLSTDTNEIAQLKSGSTVIGNKPALIKEGEYIAEVTQLETKIMFKGRPKIYIRFKVWLGDEEFVSIERYYNATKLVGKASVDGRFSVGWKSDYLREYITLFGMPENIENMSLEVWKNYKFIVLVETVTKTSKRVELAIPLHYSKIARIKAVSHE